jgi:putative FmdB family regulatory protein
MAIYDLKCDQCGNKFEIFVSGFLKEEDKKCPDCGSREISQQFTGFFSGAAGGDSSCSAPPGGGFG